ncbi:hypothetical protein [uncultured Formosa sp.]|uniref:hypothetical protein n=1 Tax=uncultured Formosa sp. TaxID=255435 RepID=UPI00260A68D6|nr:hypothetical protein [uncultured Formosa sp.]
MISQKKQTVIQSNAELANGKKFQDLVKLIDTHIPSQTLESRILIKEISSFIGFKDSKMNRIARHN